MEYGIKLEDFLGIKFRKGIANKGDINSLIATAPKLNSGEAEK